jgi:hypothetical protein
MEPLELDQLLRFIADLEILPCQLRMDEGRFV